MSQERIVNNVKGLLKFFDRIAESKEQNKMYQTSAFRLKPHIRGTPVALISGPNVLAVKVVYACSEKTATGKAPGWTMTVEKHIKNKTKKAAAPSVDSKQPNPVSGGAAAVASMATGTASPAATAAAVLFGQPVFPAPVAAAVTPHVNTDADLLAAYANENARDALFCQEVIGLAIEATNELRNCVSKIERLRHAIEAIVQKPIGDCKDGISEIYKKASLLSDSVMKYTRSIEEARSPVREFQTMFEVDGQPFAVYVTNVTQEALKVGLHDDGKERSLNAVDYVTSGQYVIVDTDDRVKRRLIINGSTTTNSMGQVVPKTVAMDEVESEKTGKAKTGYSMRVRIAAEKDKAVRRLLSDARWVPLQVIVLTEDCATLMNEPAPAGYYRTPLGLSRKPLLSLDDEYNRFHAQTFNGFFSGGDGGSFGVPEGAPQRFGDQPRIGWVDYGSPPASGFGANANSFAFGVPEGAPSLTILQSQRRQMTRSSYPATGTAPTMATAVAATPVAQPNNAGEGSFGMFRERRYESLPIPVPRGPPAEGGSMPRRGAPPPAPSLLVYHGGNGGSGRPLILRTEGFPTNPQPAPSPVASIVSTASTGATVDELEPGHVTAAAALPLNDMVQSSIAGKLSYGDAKVVDVTYLDVEDKFEQWNAHDRCVIHMSISPDVFKKANLLSDMKSWPEYGEKLLASVGDPPVHFPDGNVYPEVDCVICLDKLPESAKTFGETAVVFSPCGHACIHGKCSEQLWEDAKTRISKKRLVCPLCRTLVSAIIPQLAMQTKY